MGFFTTKKEVKLEDFCRNFYDNFILNPKVAGVDANDIFAKQFKEKIVEVCPEFQEVEIEKIKNEILVLRFELFALAFIHPMKRDSMAIAQSVFTKQYLHEKKRDDIWEGMKLYNDEIYKAMPTGLGDFNLRFWIGVREDLTKKFIKEAQDNSITIDDSVQRAMNRLCSENLWRNKTFANGFSVVFWMHLFTGTKGTYFLENIEARTRLLYFTQMFYDGAKQSWENIKIIS